MIDGEHSKEVQKGAIMDPSLKELTRKGDQLKTKMLMDGYEAFQEWYDECLDFLARLQQTFQEDVRTPLDVQKGIAWLKETFRDE